MLTYLPCLAIHQSNIPQLLLKVPQAVVCPLCLVVLVKPSVLSTFTIGF